MSGPLAPPPRESWQQAAHRVGEALFDIGPDGYYDMTASEWREVCVREIQRLRRPPQTLWNRLRRGWR